MSKSFSKSAFKDKPEYKEVIVNGQTVPCFDFVSMSKHNETVINHIRKTKKIWCIDGSSSDKKHYFIDDRHRICGTKATIAEFIEKVDCVDNNWKEKYLRILDLDEEVYGKYCEMMTLQITENNAFKQMSCIDQMDKLKAMGNDIKKAGHCNNAALTLYRLAIEKFGEDDGTHQNCQANQIHDDLLSKLCHNVSLVYFEQNDFEKSVVFARFALILKPGYSKCVERIKLINKKIGLSKIQRKG